MVLVSGLLSRLVWWSLVLSTVVPAAHSSESTRPPPDATTARRQYNYYYKYLVNSVEVELWCSAAYNYKLHLNHSLTNAPAIDFYRKPWTSNEEAVRGQDSHKPQSSLSRQSFVLDLLPQSLLTSRCVWLRWRQVGAGRLEPGWAAGTPREQRKKLE